MSTQEEQADRKARDIAPSLALSAEELKREVTEPIEGLASMLEGLSPGQATWEPEPGEWSVAQICDHVVLGTGVGNVIRLLAEGQTPGDEDWDPPPEFKGDASDLAALRRRLDAVPAAVAELFDRAQASNRLDTTADNSLYGDLNWREWYCFLGLHAANHVEQAEQVRSAPGFPA